MTDLKTIESLWPPGALRRRRTYYGGWSPPRKETQPMDKYPEIPGEAEARRQEAEDKREMDRIDAILAPRGTDADEHLADLANDATERWAFRRFGVRSEPRKGTWEWREQQLRAADRRSEYPTGGAA